VSFRVNTLKATKEEIESVLNTNNIEFIKVEGLKNAYQLTKDEERVLWNLDIFQDGKIYLQSLSSQIPVHFLDIKK
jgi:16S rRNA C967 or C1407 C5-methylase (RsmB/RsmF family)